MSSPCVPFSFLSEFAVRFLLRFSVSFPCVPFSFLSEFAVRSLLRSLTILSSLNVPFCVFQFVLLCFLANSLYVPLAFLTISPYFISEFRVRFLLRYSVSSLYVSFCFPWCVPFALLRAFVSAFSTRSPFCSLLRSLLSSPCVPLISCSFCVPHRFPCVLQCRHTLLFRPFISRSYPSGNC